MSRIEGVPARRAGIMQRCAYWYARRQVGKVPEPMTVKAHHRWIFRGYGAYEFALERSRHVDEKIKALASLKTAALVGCPF